MKPPFIQPAVALAALLTGSSAMAGLTFGEHVTLSGFGTIGAARASTDQAQFRTDLTHGRGAADKIDMGEDSRLGLRATARINDTFTAVAQVFVSRRITHDAELDWLYGQANLPAGFDVKLGRLVLPTFMSSDSRHVGYAAHWLRAPLEVYGTYPLSSFDGSQLTWRQAVGPVNLTVQASAGSASTHISLVTHDDKVEFNSLRSINLIAETGDWLFRIGQTRSDLLFADLAPLVPEALDQFTGYGLQYDNGKAMVLAEHVTRKGVSKSWYLSGGWRFGDLTPYATVSRFTLEDSPVKPTHTEAIGLRWNVANDVALKFQVQHSTGMGAFTEMTLPFMLDPPKVRVVSVAVDFIF